MKDQDRGEDRDYSIFGNEAGTYVMWGRGKGVICDCSIEDPPVPSGEPPVLDFGPPSCDVEQQKQEYAGEEYSSIDWDEVEEGKAAGMPGKWVSRGSKYSRKVIV